jgi:hypothetical protein
LLGKGWFGHLATQQLNFTALASAAATAQAEQIYAKVASRHQQGLTGLAYSPPANRLKIYLVCHPLSGPDCLMMLWLE